MGALSVRGRGRSGRRWRRWSFHFVIVVLFHSVVFSAAVPFLPSSFFFFFFLLGPDRHAQVAEYAAAVVVCGKVRNGGKSEVRKREKKRGVEVKRASEKKRKEKPENEKKKSISSLYLEGRFPWRLIPLGGKIRNVKTAISVHSILRVQFRRQ